MKIGVLTFHRATNYGAILQAYALVQYLKKQGHDVKVVDYKPHGMGSLFASVNVSGIFRKIKRIVLNIIMLPSLKRRFEKRKMFWNYIHNILPLTEIIVDSESIPDMDAFIVGSDQVWSVCFTSGIDKFYWGLFDRKGARMISYAASAAENMSESFYSTENAKLLDSFNYISVREDELQNYLQKELPNKDIVKVLDPTLMAGVEYFEELIKNEACYKTPYLLIYQVIRSKDSLIQEYAKSIACHNNWDIVEIKDSRLIVTSNGKVSVLKGLVNPSQYVSLFKHAEFIITTSFHGTAFSLLFNRPFNVVSVSEEVDSRAKDILNQIDLGTRLVALPMQIDQTVIDWVCVNEQLSKLRIPSREFLKSSLL